ncbi:MAG: LamB/YcsF family protein [Acidimicrobiales bacterium]
MDLNADLAEHEILTGDERALLGVVTSVNVSCGAHGGSSQSIAEALSVAAGLGLTVGAHPSYPSSDGFGREPIDMDPSELGAALVTQIASLSRMAANAGTRVRYVKPHGALYNQLYDDEGLAVTIVHTVRQCDDVGLMLQAGSRAATVAEEAGIAVALEAFADRAYLPDGRLAPRSREGAVLHDVPQVVAQALAIATEHRVCSVDGTWVEVRSDSLCLHGDTPGAAALGRQVRAALDTAGVEVAPFW